MEDFNKCRKCSKVFSTQGSLKRHQKSHVRDDPNSWKSFKCNINSCTKSFFTKTGLSEHKRRTHTDKKRFPCLLKCGKMFKSNSAVKAHLNVHIGEKAFSCDYSNCDKSYTSNEGLKIHVASVHIGTRSFKCDECDKGYFTKNHLRLHISRVHKAIGRPHKCPFCEATFKSKDGLRRHIALHTQEKPYKCDQCSYQCAGPGSLRAHASTHTEIRAYQCVHCPKKYKRNGDRRQHIKDFHSSIIEPATCPTCGKVYLSPKKMWRHVAIFHRNIIFHCYFCPKTVKNYVANFETHVRRHTGEKPFFCKFIKCGYSSGSPSDLNSHVKCMHSVKKEEEKERRRNQTEFRCGVCRKVFDKVEKLRNHVKDDHIMRMRRK